MKKVYKMYWMEGGVEREATHSGYSEAQAVKLWADEHNYGKLNGYFRKGWVSVEEVPNYKVVMEDDAEPVSIFKDIMEEITNPAYEQESDPDYEFEEEEMYI